jgi:hypothetical protein
MVLLAKCRKNQLGALKGFFGKKYTRKQLKIKAMEMKKRVKQPEIDIEKMPVEDWLCERTDWHLWDNQWKIDQDIVMAVLGLGKQFGSLKILCLDRGIGQIPKMLLNADLDVDCLAMGREDIEAFWRCRGLKVIKLENLTKNYYDVILIVDWFEHLDDEQFDITCQKVKEAVKKDNKFIMKSFVHNDRHRHYEWTDYRKKVIINCFEGGRNAITKG